MTHFSHDYEQGIKDERERIIKLLKTVYRGQIYADHSIRLINGDERLLATLGWSKDELEGEEDD